MTEWKESVCKKAIEKYGETMQSDKAIEEMSELTKAIIKNRIYKTEQTKTDILEEIADVEITCHQLREIYDKGTAKRVDKMMDWKLRRLEKKMESEA